ncbi:MAG: hypothetical protein ACRD2W_24580 [Acidimicrobiales bacterium]
MAQFVGRPARPEAGTLAQELEATPHVAHRHRRPGLGAEHEALVVQIERLHEFPVAVQGGDEQRMQADAALAPCRLGRHLAHVAVLDFERPLHDMNVGRCGVDVHVAPAEAG